MKNIQFYIILFVSSFLAFSCEDVIDVDLNTAAPKLVIDASIKWEKETTGQTQKIKLTTTTDFYSNTIPPATGATVVITNTTLSTPVSYQFIEDGQTGEYICTTFEPIINNDYSLTVVYKGETYIATSKFMPTPKIEKTEQIKKSGFDGKDVYEIKFYFQDNAAEENFYLAGVKNESIAYPEYGVLSDEFFQGNLMFAVYQDDNLKQGDIIAYNLQGVTEKYSNYMNKLLNIAGSDGGNPFSTPPATLRGNIVNTTNPDNYPLGYFHLSEMDSDDYTIQ